MNISLQQNGKTAKLFDLNYRPKEGFQEDNTRYVSEQAITTASDIKLEDGPAMIQFQGQSHPVTISVFEYQVDSLDEDEESEPQKFPIELSREEGLPQLALALGLLDHMSQKEREDLLQYSEN